jgi:DNA polymerase III delta subunit
LNKLIDYKSEDGTITIEDIKKVCAGYQLFNIFELGDVIVEGKTPKTLRMMQSLIGAGTSVDLLMALLQKHFLSLYLVKNGKPLESKRAFLTSKFRRQARAYSNQQLEGIIIELAEADAETRQQRFPEELVLETLAIKLSKKN